MDEIEVALNAGLWRLALMSTLALPDICAALDAEDGKTSKAKYVAWTDAWLKPRYQRVDGEELYRMRCSFLHRGKTDTREYDRIIFTLPGSNTTMHNNVIDAALNLDIITFCSDVMTAVRHWYENHRENAQVKDNMKDLVRLYPDGLVPYASGISLIS